MAISRFYYWERSLMQKESLAFWISIQAYSDQIYEPTRIVVLQETYEQTIGVICRWSRSHWMDHVHAQPDVLNGLVCSSSIGCWGAGSGRGIDYWSIHDFHHGRIHRWTCVMCCALDELCNWTCGRGRKIQVWRQRRLVQWPFNCWPRSASFPLDGLHFAVVVDITSPREMK